MVDSTTARLIDSRRKALQALVGSYSTPVYRLLDDGEPDFWCTGFFLSFGEQVVLVSAAHALADHAPALILSTGVVTELDNQVLSGVDTLGHADPINDVGSVLLSAREASALRPRDIVPLSAVAPFEYRTPAHAYLAMGYHTPGQTADHDASAYYHDLTSLVASPAHEKYYAATRLPADRVLLIGASPASFRSAQGRGGVPKFRGMSGSPVWRFNPREEYSPQYIPPLVAMLVGQPPHTRKALTCIRIGVVLQHLAAAYPQLRSHVPRFA